MHFNSKYPKTLQDRFWQAFGGASKSRTKLEIDNSLHYAALTNKLWRADYLLRERAADVTSSENFCLRWAARGGFVDMMTMLIDKGADVNAKEGEPLINAVAKGHADAVTLLLAKGADPALHRAKAVRMADEMMNVALLQKMLEDRKSLDAVARELLDRARENQNATLTALYEKHLGITPPAPPKPKPPKLKG